MRTIKFKAWGLKSKRMMTVSGVTYTPTGIQIEVMKEGLLLSNISSEMEWWWEGKEAILMQYTGKGDKNGVPIYEGDIVKCIYTTFKTETWNEVVKFEKSFAGFTPFCKPVDYEEIYLDDYEVIGNIYENPELCKTLQT